MHMHDIDLALQGSGLICFGGFELTPADGIDGRCLLLIGNAGPTMWRAFKAARSDTVASLDAWTRAAVEPAAAALQAKVFYPFDGPPYRPFQQWAERCGTLFPSPLGITIHPVHGLWHAYRAALVFAEPVTGLPAKASASPCASCAGRPCLSACPVMAFDGQVYDVPACLSHLDSAAGVDCRTRGCLARHACPVGRLSVYDPEQAAFHMAAFRRLASG